MSPGFPWGPLPPSALPDTVLGGRGLEHVGAQVRLHPVCTSASLAGAGQSGPLPSPGRLVLH